MNREQAKTGRTDAFKNGRGIGYSDHDLKCRGGPYIFIMASSRDSRLVELVCKNVTGLFGGSELMAMMRIRALRTSCDLRTRHLRLCRAAAASCGHVAWFRAGSKANRA